MSSIPSKAELGPVTALVLVDVVNPFEPERGFPLAGQSQSRAFPTAGISIVDTALDVPTAAIFASFNDHDVEDDG